ncbi:hypothetical protein PENSPDRAFT_670038 [Peniophora sp. CONT]|nr:hypothetical protein PENSPDRAFT_670038 [Peniophora sp. CONT]
MSTNGVMNRGIAKRLNKWFPYLKLNTSTIDIRCAVHVINLSCQYRLRDVLYGVGAAPPTDKVDTYLDVKAHGLVPETYAPENDEDLHEEERLQKAEIEAERDAAGVAFDHDERSLDSDDSEYDDSGLIQDDDGDASWADDDKADISEQPAREAAKKCCCRRVLTPVTQVHELVVHILRSSTWHHRFRRIAISSYLESLPVGLTEKKKKAVQAKQKRMSVSDSGWEMIDTMVMILTRGARPRAV